MDTNMDFMQVANIKVVGVGGGGCNAIKNMIQEDVQGVDFYIANTDAQVLNGIDSPNKIILGRDLTHGLGAGGNPEVGRKAALETENDIREALTGANMVFIAAGMGGGTGTGAAPIIAKIARDMGALTVAVVTSPFTFEGPKRMRQALSGLAELRENVDSIIVVSNDRLLDAIGGRPMSEAFKEADNVLRQGVQTITDLIATPCVINLDFADVSSIMKNRGNALIGIGMSDGDDKAEEAAKRAISSPLLDVSIAGAKDAIVNVTGGSNITLYDANKALATIREAVGNDVNTILGVHINEQFDDQIIVTIIATGFEEEKEEEQVVNTAPKAQQSVINKTYESKVKIDEVQQSINDDDFDDDVPRFLKHRKI